MKTYVLQESFTYPVLSENLRQAGKTFKCKETDAEFQPKKLTLQMMDIKLVIPSPCKAFILTLSI